MKSALLPTMPHVMVLVLYHSLHPTVPRNWGYITIIVCKKRGLLRYILLPYKLL